MSAVMRLTVFIFLLAGTTTLAQAPLVSLKDGRLQYGRYANEGQNDLVNAIPDFSFAGYKKGGVLLPVVPEKIRIKPVGADCREVIQKAIDKVSVLPADANGIRGAVVLEQGIYPVEGSLTINTSGVVLRGEGNSTSGTVLICKQKSKTDFIIVEGTGSGYREAGNSRRKITSPYVPTGAKTFEIEHGHSFSKGDAIVIEKIPNDRWITELQMAQYGWKASDYKTIYERTIVSIKGDEITVDIPIVDPIENRYGGGEVFRSEIRGRISQSGVENLRVESVFDNNEDENHGWNAIVLKRAENCWVINVVAKYFGYACVNISEMSVFNTVQDCAMIDPKSITTGSRKYSFNIEHGSTCNLFQRCIAWGGRHDYVTGARVPGPNVFLDCVAENTFADVGPHHRWSTGVLFDNIYCGELRVQNRKAMGSGHGWAGVQTLFWNCYSSEKEIKVESPVGAKNWGIGCVGTLQNGSGYWEKWGEHVAPRSLYLKQLEERLGAQAVKNITSEEQRSGVIWDLLKNRAAHIVEENKVMAP
jgi:hypothetical protein